MCYKIFQTFVFKIAQYVIIHEFGTWILFIEIFGMLYADTLPYSKHYAWMI